MPGKKDARYEVIIGGITLIQDGKIITVAGATGHYYDMEFKHVQGVWETMDDEEIAMAMGGAQMVTAKKLVELGHAYGVEDERMTEEDLGKIKKIKERMKKKDG